MAHAATSKHERTAELGRFVLNGLGATAVHYTVLSFNIHVLQLQYAATSNFVASWFGLAASFLGSRYFVFKAHRGPIGHQAMRFIALYMFLALMQGAILYLWTDRLGFSYTWGFLIATGFQTIASYIVNRHFVFLRAEKINP